MPVMLDLHHLYLNIYVYRSDDLQYILNDLLEGKFEGIRPRAKPRNNWEGDIKT